MRASYQVCSVPEVAYSAANLHRSPRDGALSIQQDQVGSPSSAVSRFLSRNTFVSRFWLQERHLSIVEIEVYTLAAFPASLEAKFNIKVQIYHPMSLYDSPTDLHSRQGPYGVAAPGLPERFRTPEDEAIAHDILVRNKEVKIESRSRLSRAFTTKSKRTKFSDRETFRALASVVKGKEIAGPGVVEVLTGLFLDQHGDVNFEPQKKSMGSIFRKGHQERSRLLETCAEAGNAEFVQILSRHSDKTSLDNSLEIALQNRGTSANRDAIRQDLMIRTLISRGANGSNTIGAAVRAGDETLLSMLLQGRPPQATLSEALPLASTFPAIDIRHRILSMLLENGADLNYNSGESIFHVTKLFDMVSLDMLLEHRPRPESLSQAFAQALNLPDSRNRFEACQKLIHSGAVGDEVNRGLSVAITAEYQNIEFLKLILLSASVDFEDGHALSLAVTNEYMAHLQLMLEKRPNQTTFDGAFASAMRIRNPRDQLKYCRTLVAAGPPRDSCSKALLIAVKAQKEELCKIFLEKGASPDFEQGASITAAVLKENIGILEMLIGGEYQKPESNSLIAAFEATLSMSSSRPKKTKLLRLLLDAGLKGPPLDTALVNESRKGSDGMALCNLFLDYGASINWQGGEALDISTRSGDLELLKMLLQGPHQPLPEVLSRIFQSALKLDPRLRYQAIELILDANMPINDQVAAAVDFLVGDRRFDMQTIQVLLSFGASVHYQNHRPLVTAAKSFNKKLLSLLLAHSQDQSASSFVFDVLIKIEGFWSKKDSFSIFTILLENGAEGTSVNDALIKVVADTQPSARHFEATLLQHGVDIDYKDGEALQIAAERGEPGLVKRMLEMNPSADSVSMAFPYAFHSKLGEASTLAVIELFVELAADQLDPDFMHPEIPEPPVFLCLNHYPTSPRVLKATLKAGFRVDETMSSESGKYTAIYWSLSTQGKKIADPLVELLITEGPDLQNHPEPLLHLAIENGRPQVLQFLIDKGADVDVADETGVTPLSTATLKNDIRSMQALLDATACPNDGSLHEAAHMANTEAINLLMSYGHEPNFPSVRFDGRPPLFELCYKAPTYLQQSQATAQQKEKQIKKAIQALIKGGALTTEQLPQAGNRSILIHAIDSANPHMMVKAFLECVPFKDVNKDFNLFTNGEYTYSPTMYVKKGKSLGDKTQSQTLVKLLETFSAFDRYWKNEGAQPPDMKNPPKHIQDAEDERKAIEKRRREEEEERRRQVEEEQRQIAAARMKIALEQEAEQAKQDRAEKLFKQRQAHEAKMHEAQIAKQNDQLKIQEARDAHALRQAASLSQLRNDENEAEHRRRLTFVSEKKRLAESEAALGWAYNQGLQNAGMTGPGGRRALGMSSKSNIDLGGRRKRIEGGPSGSTPRIWEIDEE
ncbi:hypothetical protein G7Y89_g3872 [Cudoniella acicularis]|uniref:Uncharacterized protein n=1 Tax=Cudoniella acicularis TaxID=354080 RepID=A0A8H4RTI7_9HELO|nr:hypothetical protein G7Y89_g3872 [Cudoniella acicularis]